MEGKINKPFKKLFCAPLCSDKTSAQHRFPKREPEVFKSWLRNINNVKLHGMLSEKIYQNFRVCDRHFIDDCKLPGKRGLKRKAVPTLFIPDTKMSFKEINVDEVHQKDKYLKKKDVQALREWINKQPHLPKVTGEKMSFKEINVDEVYQKDKNLKKEDVQALREWINKQPHLPKVTELQLALFLHSTYYSIETAKNTIDMYFTIKTKCPDIFGSRTFDDKALQAGLNCYMFYPLPTLTPTGDTVILSKLSDTAPSSFSFVGVVKLYDVGTLLHVHQNGPTNGVQLIVDMSGSSLGHLLKVNTMVAKKFAYYLEEGMPIRLKHVHFINVVTFMDKLFALLKQLLNQELINMLLVHTEIESLYKYVPKEILPEEYGGKEQPISKLGDTVKNFIKTGEDLLKFQEKQLVDESKRKGPSKYNENLFGLDGSFKKLEID